MTRSSLLAAAAVALALIGFGLTALTVLSPPGVPTAPPPAPPPELEGTAATGWDWSRLDVALVRAVESVPGTRARIRIERGGEVLYDRRLGPEGPELVPTGSVRKWTTAAAVMVLVDRGQLDLDDPVSAYVKAYDTPDKREITIRQTLAHTSGIVMKPPKGLCAGAVTLGACVARTAEVPLLHEPGSHFHYSTMAYNVAARAVEQIVQQPFHQFWDEVIATPLGMEQSAFVAAGPGLPQMAGMLVTSPEEFSHFLEMILGDGDYRGTRVLSEAAVAEMERGQTGGVPKKGRIPRREWWREGEDYYGLGVWRNLLFEDGSPRIVSAEGKHGFVTFIDREHDVSVVLSMQYGRLPIPDKVRIDPVDVIYTVCDVLADAAGENPEPNPHCLPEGRAGVELGSPTF